MKFVFTHFSSSFDDEDDDFFSASDDREENEKSNLIKSFGTPSTDVSPSKKKSNENKEHSANVSAGSNNTNTSPESMTSVTANSNTKANNPKKKKNKVKPDKESVDDDNEDEADEDESTKYEPLQLVWAKCRGYPWYPALIIDPTMPKNFIYFGVPLPSPPKDVLELRKDKTEPVYLVLFFDAKRTWQWLPPSKLEKLGINDRLDKSKLTESRKQSKAVKKAYEDALNYHSQVTDITGQGPGAIA